MKITAGMIRRSRTFWGVIAAFLVANLLSAVLPAIGPAQSGQEISIGFPFPVHVSDGVSRASEFYLSGLLLDLVVPPTVAISIVWIGRLIGRPEDGDE